MAKVIAQWLLGTYTRSLLQLGAHAGREQLSQYAKRLVARWREPGRFFHNLAHLTQVLEAVDEIGDVTHRPAAMRVLAWYHGAVFTPNPAKTGDLALLGLPDRHQRSAETLASGLVAGLGENPFASAVMLGNDLSELGVPAKEIRNLQQILTTLHERTLPADDMQAQVLNDAELRIFSAAPQDFREYSHLVRREHSHLDDLEYVRARRQLLFNYLSRDRIYVSPLGMRWENAARANLTAEVTRLNQRYSQLAPDATDLQLQPAVPMGPLRFQIASRSQVVLIRGLEPQVRNTSLDPTKFQVAGSLLCPVQPRRAQVDSTGISTLETAGDFMDEPAEPPGAATEESVLVSSKERKAKL